MPPILFKLKKLVIRNDTRTQKGVPPSLSGGIPLPPLPPRYITGVSRDNNGNPLGGCTCTLFKVRTNTPYPVYTQVDTTVSDGSGNYTFLVGFDGPYRVTFDLNGAPIRAGLTLNTLSGV